MVRVARIKLDSLMNRNLESIENNINQLKQLLQDDAYKEITQEIFDVISLCQGF